MPTCDNNSEMKDPLDLVDDNNLFNKLGHGTADLGPGDDNAQWDNRWQKFSRPVVAQFSRTMASFSRTDLNH